MKTNYESLFSRCSKTSQKWMALSNSLVAVAVLNSLFNTAFAIFGHFDYIEYQALTDRLLLLSFGCIGVAVLLILVSLYAAHKLRSEWYWAPHQGCFSVAKYIFWLKALISFGFIWQTATSGKAENRNRQENNLRKTKNRRSIYKKVVSLCTTWVINQR